MIEVRLLNGRYHGVGDWPPSPFRLFQALVAGAYGGRWITEPRHSKDAAFRWLERLEPPCVVSPPHIEGRVIRSFVPNNDLDAMGGDPRRVAEIRVEKQTKSVILSADFPFIYAWPFEDDEPAHAELLCEMSGRLHTLGRGIDSAFARGQVADWNVALEQLREHGRVSTPSGAVTGEQGLRCPAPGSFDSLVERFVKRSRQLDNAPAGSPVSTLFRQPPKARCMVIRYDRSPARLLFDIRRGDDSDSFRALPQVRAVDVATAVRDLAVGRLTRVLPARAAELERVIVGRGSTPSDPSRRVRIIPLPSIGFTHATGSIRRVLVEVPWECPIAPRDVAWAISGQSLPTFHIVDQVTGEVLTDAVLVPAADEGMLHHYGVGKSSRTWRSVTPVALPLHRQGGLRSANDRAGFERQVASAVVNALRHAALPYRRVQVRVQREPFRSKDAMAPTFASGRFSAGVLHHVEVALAQPVTGPIVIGDGRWLGLGVMAPASDTPPAVYLFRVAGGTWRMSEVTSITRAVRRAVLSLAGSFMNGGRELPPFFTGHEVSGAPARGEYHGHLFYLGDDSDEDGLLDRVAIVAPHLPDHTAKAARADLRHLERALEGLRVVRAGCLGMLELIPDTRPDDRVFGFSRVWESVTMYRPTRHPRRHADVRDALAADLRTECSRRGLPPPGVSILEVIEGPKGGLRSRARLTFPKAVKGPIVLGPGSHFGEGLFRATSTRAS